MVSSLLAALAALAALGAALVAAAALAPMAPTDVQSCAKTKRNKGNKEIRRWDVYVGLCWSNTPEQILLKAIKAETLDQKTERCIRIYLDFLQNLLVTEAATTSASSGLS